MLKEAAFWERGEDGAIQCRLCPHACVLRDGQTGRCRTRRNEDGTLMTLAYGNPCTVAVDPIEKKPLFHFFPGSRILSLATAGCTFRCRNCQNWTLSQVGPEDLPAYDLPPAEVVALAQREKTPGIAFTYTEPTVYYEYMQDTARLARDAGLKTVMVSNGFLSPQPLKRLCSDLDAANIDLKSFDEDIHRQLTGASLQPILETLIALKEKEVWLEITSLLVPGYSDDLDSIAAMCRWLVENGFQDTPLHLSRFFPNYRLPDVHPTPLPTMRQALLLAKEAGLRFVYAGNVPTSFEEHTYCPGCGCLLVERWSGTVTAVGLSKGCCTNCGRQLPGRFDLP